MLYHYYSIPCVVLFALEEKVCVVKNSFFISCKYNCEISFYDARLSNNHQHHELPLAINISVLATDGSES